MKKNNPYLADYEIDLGSIIKLLRKEKILILFCSIICGLLVYFYAFLKPQEFKSEITLKNPPTQIFEPYILLNFNFNNNKNNNSDNSDNNKYIAVQFINDFKLNFLSLDNLQSFVEESREFDNFKGYLKSRNISAKQYFGGKKFGEQKEKGNNVIISSKYFINHTKELDGAIFLKKYSEFIKKKTIVEFKNNLKLAFLNTINNQQEALEIAKKVQLENPIIKTTNSQQFVVEPEALFYKGSKVISENLNNLNKRLIKLENDQFAYNIILQSITFPINQISLLLYFALGLILGLFLSLGFVFFKSTSKE